MDPLLMCLCVGVRDWAEPGGTERINALLWDKIWLIRPKKIDNQSVTISDDIVAAARNESMYGKHWGEWKYVRCGSLNGAQLAFVLTLLKDTGSQRGPQCVLGAATPAPVCVCVCVYLCSNHLRPCVNTRFEQGCDLSFGKPPEERGKGRDEGMWCFLCECLWKSKVRGMTHTLMMILSCHLLWGRQQTNINQSLLLQDSFCLFAFCPVLIHQDSTVNLVYIIKVGSFLWAGCYFLCSIWVWWFKWRMSGPLRSWTLSLWTLWGLWGQDSPLHLELTQTARSYS